MTSGSPADPAATATGEKLTAGNTTGESDAPHSNQDGTGEGATLSLSGQESAVKSRPAPPRQPDGLTSSPAAPREIPASDPRDPAYQAGEGDPNGGPPQETLASASRSTSTPASAVSAAIDSPSPAMSPVNPLAPGLTSRSGVELPVQQPLAKASDLATITLPMTSAETHLLAQQLARASRQYESTGAGELSLRLRPPHLGELRVLLVVDGKTTHVQMVVESREALQLVRDHAPELATSLRQHGITLGEMRVDVGPGSPQSHESAGEAGAGPWEPPLREVTTGGDRSERREPAAGPPLLAGCLHHVDCWA